MPYSYNDPFLERLMEDISSIILGDTSQKESIETRLIELAVKNSPEVAEYWRRTESGRGIPDFAFNTDFHTDLIP